MGQAESRKRGRAFQKLPHESNRKEALRAALGLGQVSLRRWQLLGQEEDGRRERRGEAELAGGDAPRGKARGPQQRNPGGETGLSVHVSPAVRT